MSEDDILSKKIVEAAPPPHSVRYKGEDLPVPEAFWDTAAGGPNLGALVKSQSDLRRMLSEQRPEVPEAYELAVPQDLANRIRADAEDPLAQSAMDWAKKQGLSQEAFSELAALYYGRLAEDAVDRDAEMGKLKSVFGSKAESELAGLGRWVQGLLGNTLSRDPEMERTLHHLTATADGVKLLKAFKDRLAEPAVPSFREGGVPAMDAAGLRALQASDAYLAGDPAVRRKVAEGWARLYPDVAG
jgi:hypothetical protein